MNSARTASITYFHPLPRPPPSTYASPLTRDCTRSMFQQNRPSAPEPLEFPKSKPRYYLKRYAEQTLGEGSLRKVTMLPEGEDLDEWLSVYVVDFYTQINLLYGSIAEFCSPVTCPAMKTSNEFEYLWQDHKKYKHPTRLPAPEYIEHLMFWVQDHINDEQLFPSRAGVRFPKKFRPTVRQLVKRLLRVYAHMYCHHYPVVVAMGLDVHMNTSFKHYVLFVREFSLESGEGFYGPLEDMAERIVRTV